MSKSIEKKTKCKPKSIPLKSHVKNVYRVGVYFPGEDVMNFYVTAHDFYFLQDGTGAQFYNVGEMGIKDFVGSFKNVVYILIASDMPKEEKPILPLDFGKIV